MSAIPSYRHIYMVFAVEIESTTPALKVLCYYQLSYAKSLRPITVGVSPDNLCFIVAVNYQPSTLAEQEEFESSEEKTSSTT